MTKYLNLLPENIRKVSRFPFDPLTDIQIGNHILPYALILSLHLVLNSGYAPISMGEFRLLGTVVKIYLQDAQKNTVGICNLLPLRRLHLIKDGVLTVGQMQATPILYSFLLGLLQSFGGLYIPLQPSFILDTRCISCCRRSGCIALNVLNLNLTFTDSVVLRFLNNITSTVIQQSDTQIFNFSVCADPIQIILGMRTPIQTVNGIDVTNAHLIIRPSLYSNLRVDSALLGKLKLIGVLDA